MTVAAVIVAPDPAAAVAALDGQPLIRRILDAAWAGGATPAVIVSPDAEGILARTLGDAAAAVLVPGSELPHGIAWFAAGLDEAIARVSETTAALLWPFRMPWVDPETVTSLIEAHGVSPSAVIQPTHDGAAGFPILIPAAYGRRLFSMAQMRGTEALGVLLAAGVPAEFVEVGDPGISHDLMTQRDRMPEYRGPSQPAGGTPPEWNEAIGVRAGDAADPSEAARSGAAALEGGAAPYDQAEREA